jgi:CxxC motif-containing protein
MEEMTKIICITCPKGCTLEVNHEGDTIIEVKAGCKRGKDYAKAELTDPRRMVATSVQVNGGRNPLLPVYTSAPFPKPLIRDLLVELRYIQVNAPVHMDQVILANALGTGIDIKASREYAVLTDIV